MWAKPSTKVLQTIQNEQVDKGEKLGKCLIEFTNSWTKNKLERQMEQWCNSIISIVFVWFQVF